MTSQRARHSETQSKHKRKKVLFFLISLELNHRLNYDKLLIEDVVDFCHHAEPLPLNGAEMCTEDSRPTVTTLHIFSSNEGNRRENNSFQTDFG